jgi:uncharacterized DUF497 family protein
VALRFEWDPQKAATVFGDPLGRIASDPRHSEDEERFVLLGLSRQQHLLAVMFAEPGDAIRIISVRRARPRERRDYEQAAP